MQADEKVSETVTHEGDLRLPQSGALAERLRAAFAAGRSVELDLAGVEDVDLSGLQLVCSAHRTYCAGGLEMKLKSVPARFREQAREMGFHETTAMCPYRAGRVCLWR